MEEIIKRIIRDNWVSHWGNSMTTDDRDRLEEECLAMLSGVYPNPTSIIIHALIAAQQPTTQSEG